MSSGVPQPTAAAVVPAAGASRRMGRPKLLLPFGDGTVLGALVGALRVAGVSPIVVVAAAGDPEMRAWCADAIAAAATTDAAGLTVALNAAPERGMLSSILAGLAALGGAGTLVGGRATLLVCPGDLPALRPDTVVELLRRREAAGAGLAVPVYRGRRGHPLAVAPVLIPEIESLDPGRGLRQLLDLHPDDLLTVEVDDPGCVADLDTPEDYERLRAGSGTSRAV
ncbi:MAG TPA: NTP transferase domain-containing protein [Thermoanaerobaculia bacterium]|jgi:CTP:molybdopterin cytidylyltransferase MocA|nr:NTP transferase domain-containing protein [Thermoanaerobaculia bacterium]